MRYLLPVVLFIGLASCGEDVSFSNALTGSYKMTLICGGILGCQKPDEPIILEITKTRYEMIRSDSVYFSQSYQVLKDTTTEEGRVYTLELNSTAQKTITFKDDLISIYSNTGFSEQYIRIGL